MTGMIVVRFDAGTSEKEIYDLLDEYRLRGTKVSDFVKRWTIEVPPDKEEHFIETFRNNELVESVSSSFIKGHKPGKRMRDGDEASSGDSERPQNETREGNSRAVEKISLNTYIKNEKDNRKKVPKTNKW